jgi:hypothetical protein
MFDPIKGPSNLYQAPATGLGTEAGDTWHEAVRKVNEGFKNVIQWAEGLGDGGDGEARKGVAALEDAVAALQKRNDDLDAQMKALLGSFDKFLAAQAAPPTGDAPKTEAEKPQG